MSSRESDLEQVSCRIGGVSAIADAVAATEQFGKAQWLERDELARLCIVVEELVANLYDHGGVTAKVEIELSFRNDPAGIAIVIVDPGNPFDPSDMSRTIERTERGGAAGIDIVRAWAQFVSYDVTEAGNRLELLLPLHWSG